MQVSFTEENYLKTIYKLSQLNDHAPVSTNEISEALANKAATVTEMMKRLSEKQLISYQKYQGVKLTEKGRKMAVKVVRKHRLWEVFLVDKLHFTWDEVHDIAEQLEHIQSDELIDRLDAFLGHPKFDPHGDPIPDAKGKFSVTRAIPLATVTEKGDYILLGVSDHNKKFLQHLSQIGLKLGDVLRVTEIVEYDNSFRVKINNKQLEFLSKQAASHILVEPKHE